MKLSRKFQLKKKGRNSSYFQTLIAIAGCLLMAKKRLKALLERDEK